MSKEMTNAELDALIAERVMGWQMSKNGSARIVVVGRNKYKFDWHPTEDISQAMQAVEKVVGVGQFENRFVIVIGSDMQRVRVYGEMGNEELADEFDPELPLAICKAIASALEVA